MEMKVLGSFVCVPSINFALDANHRTAAGLCTNTMPTCVSDRVKNAATCVWVHSDHVGCVRPSTRNS